MVDASLVRLLRECDNYLSRQRSLLDLAAAAFCDSGVLTAMDAALDQLTGAVVDGWSTFQAEIVGNRDDVEMVGDRDGVDQPDPRPEPGE
ncbi:MAG TPA: hypothetical protein VH502_09740 [Actinoplanes sp.]|jgi:predicted lipoprotein